MDDPTPPSDNRPSAEEDSTESSPADFLHDAQGHIDELGEYAGMYVSAKMAEMRRFLRRAIFFAVLGIIAVLALIAVVITAGVLLCAGVAHLLANLLGGRMWAGELITGAGIIVLGGLAIMFMASVWRKAGHRRTVYYYESRKQEQLRRFGRNIEEDNRQ